MISMLSLAIFLSIIKLMMEVKLLFILMIMEMISLMIFFLVLCGNTEALTFTSCLITMLTILISESVLSLTIFINLMRESSSAKVSSTMLKY